MILAINMNPAIDKVYSVDNYKVGGVFRPSEMTATAGGKGINVARVACLLGEKVIATGMVGGNNGKFIEDEVIKQGIDSRFVHIQGETRICINVVDKKNSTCTEILEPGPTISAKEIESFLNCYKKLLEKCNVVAASGSLPKGVPDDFYKELIQIANNSGKKFILDTSGGYFKEAVVENPYMIKPNVDELRNIFNDRFESMSDYIAAIKRFKSQGIQLPVVSLGKNGCVAALEDGIYHFTTPEVKVVNTVGSGDSFVAGCAVGLSRGLSLKEVIKLGMACGTANTQFFETGFVSVDLVEKFFSMIGCNKIE